MKFNKGKIVNLIQGSPEWHELRAKRFTASEAPAMMGKSKYQSRSALLKQKATGLVPEVDAHTQRIFDEGHKAEAAARPIAEKLIGEELFPVVLDDADGGYLASMDGLTMLGDIGWEHKMLNQALAAQIDAGELDEHYRIQMDQQFALSGAERIIFVGSDGTEENFKYLWIERDESRFAAIESGWDQFAKDLAEYVPIEKPAEIVGDKPDSLPALNIAVEGAVTASNLPAFKERALAMISGVKTDLKTDKDFLDAAELVKAFKAGEDELEVAKKRALSQAASIEELFRTVDDVKEKMRSKRLELSKLVESKKDARKLEILQTAKQDFDTFLRGLDVGQYMPMQLPDFAGAMKGKRTISSLQGACDDLTAKAKIEANEVAAVIRDNLAYAKDEGSDYEFLFSDIRQICDKPADDFIAVVKSRIADHKEAEQKRLDAEREKIRQEEEAKAKRQADAEMAKAEQARRERYEEGEKVVSQEVPDTKKPAHEMPPLDFAKPKGEQVTISAEEYESLVHNSKMYLALAAAGVDNWDGYDMAMEIMEGAA